ncbi:hypothetical protein C7M84_020418 [Penaeus vannamei]|uniref:Uncharacterized protein n=1 Tax=Penaeus vannamei TaxID=6689 RepID=A0A423SC89_PENVA|nr:hypothetical protein C7M84_020418 [Penaeus vannamei]
MNSCVGRAEGFMSSSKRDREIARRGEFRTSVITALANWYSNYWYRVHPAVLMRSLQGCEYAFVTPTFLYLSSSLPLLRPTSPSLSFLSFVFSNHSPSIIFLFLPCFPLLSLSSLSPPSILPASIPLFPSSSFHSSRFLSFFRFYPPFLPPPSILPASSFSLPFFPLLSLFPSSSSSRFYPSLPFPSFILPAYPSFPSSSFHFFYPASTSSPRHPLASLSFPSILRFPYHFSSLPSSFLLSSRRFYPSLPSPRLYPSLPFLFFHLPSSIPLSLSISPSPFSSLPPSLFSPLPSLLLPFSLFIPLFLPPPSILPAFIPLFLPLPSIFPASIPLFPSSSSILPAFIPLFLPPPSSFSRFYPSLPPPSLFRSSRFYPSLPPSSSPSLKKGRGRG